MEWDGWPLEEDEDDKDTKVIDLGEAFLQDAVPESPALFGGLPAPEVIFNIRFDHRLELWCVDLIVRFPPPTL